MEATKEEGGGLLNKIRPPRLEDAGLEDCALSQESIKEAFFKAANSVRSWAGAEVESDSDDHCIEGKTPNHGGLPDSLIGVPPPSEPSASCSNQKGGGLPDVLGDEVRVGGDDVIGEKGIDKVLDSNVPGTYPEEGGKSCVDALQGLKIHENDDEDDTEESEKAILVEGLI